MIRFILTAITTMLVLISAVSFVQSQNGSCKYNGRSYPNGAIIGPFVCKNGQWVNR